jgi:hypothetical protein
MNIIIFFFNITIFIYTKKKTIIFSCYIKDSVNIIEIKPCFIYMLSGYKYIFN